jgi:hypothetical protein
MRTFGITLLILLVVAPVARAADEVAPFTATWSDGSQTDSAEPMIWLGHERPQLGKMSPLFGGNMLRRLRTTALVRQAYSGGRIELVGGDRLTGRVVEYLSEATSGPARPACLVVEPVLAPDEPVADVPPRIRVPIERIRRVVFEERTPRPYAPNTLVYRDGRQMSFRSLRWAPGEVRLLVEQGVENVGWDDVAEVHLAERDPWEQYADQLAILSPDVGARLVRLETPSGLRVTSSLERLRVTGDVAKPESQVFLVHPAWSLDRFSLPQRLLLAQSFFLPHEVPLSNFEPSGYFHRAALAGGWRQWRADADVQGDPLASGGREFGWGFGVHGHAELQFELPVSARAFRTRLGLDRAAGDGGSVQARIYFGPNQAVDAVQGKPLFESPPLVGSAAVVDSGRLELRPTAGRANRLVLVCDALEFDRPPNTDPLDVRDTFDWLEPLVELDAAYWKATIVSHAASLFVREHRWTIASPYGDAWRWNNHAYGERYGLIIEAIKRPLVVARNLTVPPETESLVVHAGVPDERGGKVVVKLQVNGKVQSEAAVPLMTDPTRPPALRLPVPANLRGREIRFELVFQGTTEVLRVDVRGIETPGP